MNNNFSISRYKNLLAIDWQAYHKKYLFIALAMLLYWVLYGFAATWFLLDQKKNIFTNPGAIRLALNVQMLGFICFITSTAFTELGSDIRRTGYFLMLPCTALEKFAARFLVSAILFWGVFFLSLFIGLWLVWNVFYGAAVGGVELTDHQFNLYHRIKMLCSGSIFIHAFLYHSIFTLGAITLKRFKFIKSLLLIIVFYIIVGLLGLNLIQNIYYLSVCAMLTIIFWFLAYYKLNKYTLT